MTIQYRNMNPFNQIVPGIQAGMQMRQMMDRNKKASPQPSDAVIADPGVYQPVKMENQLQAEEQDLNKLNKLQDNKAFKKLDDEGKSKVIDSYIKGGAFQTPVGKSLARNINVVGTDEINKIYMSIKNQTPEAQGNITLLFELTKDDPEVQKSINEKMTQIQSAENENRGNRALVLKKTLEDIDSVTDNPLQWQGKTGITNPQTTKVVQNRNQYLQELRKLNPELFKEYYEGWKNRKSGGKPRQTEFVGLKKDERGKFQRFPFTAPSVESGLQQYPFLRRQDIERMQPEKMGSRFIATDEARTIEREKAKTALSTPRKGKKYTRDEMIEIRDEYIEFYGDNKKAKRAMKAAGW